MNARHAGLLMVAATIFGGGCSDRDLRPLNPCTITGVVRKVPGAGSQNVDLLMMVDNSGSMEAEQRALQAQLGTLAEVLTTGDLDGDDVQDFPPVASLRVGVITSDMGILGVGEIPTPITTDPEGTLTTGSAACTANDHFFGDDGRIQLVSTATAQATLEGCQAEYPNFLQFNQEQGETARDVFVNSVSCTAVLGTDGCGFEMQLESILTAVTDSSRANAPTFAPTTAMGASRNRQGQAGPGGANEGFFRDDSVIAIVAVTDEEDCSTPDPDLFIFDPRESPNQDPAHNDYATIDYRVNTRCQFFEQKLYNIQRYVDGLRALRPDEPNKIVFAGIIGLPEDLENGDPATILEDGRMQYIDRIGDNGVILDPIHDPFYEPACWRCEADPTVSNYADCPDPNVSTVRNEGLAWAAPGRR
ncbi:MAG: hypothetical protein H5U40_03750, partial [Polyangiaceae bacterium]|nr:hypothetical protein [Polyangiaceae bacterium]